MSDTHSHHKNVIIPEGDVLLHTGDLTGNYGPYSDLKKQFKDIIEYFKILSKKF